MVCCHHFSWQLLTFIPTPDHIFISLFLHLLEVKKYKMTILRSRSVSEAEHLLTYYQDDHVWLILKIQVRGDRWVSYDDEHSVRLKAEFAFDKKLAGVMVWSVETDDFKVDITSIANNKNKSFNVQDFESAMDHWS